MITKHGDDFGLIRVLLIIISKYGGIMNYIISNAERSYLRELAKRQLELANLPIMTELEHRWYEHNEGLGEYPMILMETKYCEDDLIDLVCESVFAKELELEIKRHVVNYDLVRDDRVVPSYHTIYWETDIKTLNLDMSEKRITDPSGKSVGYTTIQHLKDLPENMHKIGKTVRRIDKKATLEHKVAVEEVIGDILPVKIKNNPSFNWAVSPSKKAEYLMGLESMMFAPYDCPDEFHQLYRILVDDILETFTWMSEEGILELNNGNDYAGSGSYGFSHSLPTDVCKKNKIITTQDLWVNLNSQETVGISPEMYGEYYWPYYKELASHFGLTYYGCCEPTDPIWDEYLSKLTNLRKLSVSPWADEVFLAEKLRGTNIVYCKKPSPNYLALNIPFDEKEYYEHIKKSVIHAQGCHLEISCRDVYALSGDREKLGKAVNIIREVVGKYYR